MSTTDGPVGLSRDFSEFIASFAAHDVRFLVVGGYALAAHGHPRYTKDLDVWVWLDPSNAKRILAALDEFGFGDLGLTVEDFLDPDVVVQLGREPQRVDLLTFLSGIDFGDAYRDRILVDIGDIQVPVISRGDLRRNKLATGRLQDLADVEHLAPDDAP